MGPTIAGGEPPREGIAEEGVHDVVARAQPARRVWRPRRPERQGDRYTLPRVKTIQGNLARDRMPAYHSKGVDSVLLEEDPGLLESDEASGVWTGSPPETELKRLLLAARREFFAAEGRFLSREELAQELAERRGVSAADDEARFELTSTPVCSLKRYAADSITRARRLS